jgi:hypothetical protein
LQNREVRKRLNLDDTGQLLKMSSIKASETSADTNSRHGHIQVECCLFSAEQNDIFLQDRAGSGINLRFLVSFFLAAFARQTSDTVAFGLKSFLYRSIL